jgi:broad specificity phosphatase PhoE
VETVIHLMRHGQVHNPDNVRYGRAPGFHLSERGQAQARLAAGFLRAQAPPIALALSSPLERAVETAAIVTRELALPPAATDPRLIEPPNNFDGLLRTAPLNPWLWPQLWNPFRPSWSEPFIDVARRVRAVLEELRMTERGACILVVSHQAPIWITRQSYEAALGPPWLARVHCSPASITTLRFGSADRYLGYTYWSPPEGSTSSS